eukprot:TRINITY_DN1131_c0_g1_i1.p1 TRINITY_DN1131_c0_g1~~TRINITY_DN1131_c0_g1_i1.p1  ORF type:complete len:205 (+),score=49.51 TRINITY_DN1131_c0_g1_i1:94-708(+)
MDTDYDYLFKVVVIGDAGVGKTCVVKRYCDGGFSDTGIPTIGVDFSIKTLKIGPKTLKFQIWDTAGQERFRTITHSYYRSADAVIIVYDITSHESFQSINMWLQEIQRYCGVSVFKVLIGNKSDKLESRQVQKEDGTAVAEKDNMPFFETSAKENSGIDQLFHNLGEQLLAQQVGKLKPGGLERGNVLKGETVSVTGEKSWGCC